jgi:hypothetical protein
MVSRRRTLALLVAVALAGCVGGAVGPGSPVSPTDTPDAAPTDTPGECTEPDRTPVDPVREGVTPSEYPDRPEEWTESSAREYVVAFEEAWSRNERLRPDTRRVTTSVWDVSVLTVEDGYRVRLTSQTNTWYGGPADGNETATVVHGDGPQVPVAYHLSDGRLVRAEGDHQSTPTVGPATGWTARCFD